MESQNEYLEEHLEEVRQAYLSGDIQKYEQKVREGRQIVKTRKMLADLNSGTHIDKKYMQKEELDTAYKHALDSPSPTVEACFEQVVEVHNVSPDYIEEVRTSPCRDIKQVITDNNKHPSVKRMEKNRVMAVEELKKSTTPNQLITNITLRRSVSDRLDTLESQVSDLQNRLGEVEVMQAANTLHIEDLLEAVEIPKDRNIENAKKLRAKGYLVGDIATILKVDRRTISRWLGGK